MPTMIDTYEVLCGHCSGPTIVCEYVDDDGKSRFEATKCSRCGAVYRFDIDLTPPPTIKSNLD